MKLFRWFPLCLLALPIAAHAGTFNLNSTSGGYTYKAQADFTYSGSILTLVLKNTQNSNLVSAGNAQILTGLFWNMNRTVTASTANISAGSSYVDGNGNALGTPSETPAQHWARKQGAPSWGGGANYGIGAAGFGHFGPGDAFASGGSNPVLNGVDWGIIGGNWNIPGNESPFILNSMTFTFNIGTGFDVNSISNVWFQYGSGFSEFRGTDDQFPPSEAVPEPASIAMAGFAAAAALKGRRKLKVTKK